MINTLVENIHGTGARKNSIDLRDFAHRWKKVARAKGSVPFDWNIGYDVEKELSTVLGISNFTIPVKDQGVSSSCCGQAAAYYESVQDAFEKKVYTEKSARDSYSQIFYPGGGSSTRDVLNLLTKKGVCKESLMPSYSNGLPLSEYDMTKRADASAITVGDALTAKGTAYAPVSISIDEFAQAIRDCHGLVSTIEGANNGTWRSAFPKPPVNGCQWGHELYFGKAALIGGKKFVKVLNSWGRGVGELGWQWLGEEYFSKSYMNSAGVVYDTTTDVLVVQKNLLENILELLQEFFFGLNTKKVLS